MTIPAFDVLTNALTRGALSQSCIVEMDDESYAVRCVYVRRQIPVDVENQIYISAPVTISLALKDMPRKPRKGDGLVLTHESYKIGAEILELGNGMVECSVSIAK